MSLCHRMRSRLALQIHHTELPADRYVIASSPENRKAKLWIHERADSEGIQPAMIAAHPEWSVACRGALLVSESDA
jgi:hypothetical protein